MKGNLQGNIPEPLEVFLGTAWQKVRDFQAFSFEKSFVMVNIIKLTASRIT